MKLITAIIQPSKLDDVKAGLATAGVHGLTVSQASGYGQQHGHIENYRGATFTVDLIEKIRIDVVCHDAAVDEIVDKIVESARSGDAGALGDGKVWVTALESVTRVRSGETGSAAI